MPISLPPPSVVRSKNGAMITRFVALEIDLKSSTKELQQDIEAALRRWGDPLRWAVVTVDELQRKVFIEGVVTVAG